MSDLHRIVREADIPASGFSLVLEADAESHMQIAKRLGVHAVKELSGSLQIERAVGRIEITGRLKAVLERQCVASLEFFEERINEDFKIAFSSQPEAGREEDVEIDLNGETPEPLSYEGINLGEILIQQLSLTMSQHPKKPGAASLAEDFGAGGRISPFAGLSEKIARRGDAD